MTEREPEAQTLAEFLGWIADRLESRADMTRDDALTYADTFEIPPLNNPSYDWSRSAAHEMADDELSYWED